MDADHSQEDPIFGLIRQHREAWQAYSWEWEAFAASARPASKADDQRFDALVDAADAAMSRLLATRPTTTEAALALMLYRIDHKRAVEGDHFDPLAA